jgi:hypothetical protein
VSLLELCDVAYGIIVGQLERQYLADRQAFGVAVLLNQDTESVPPSWDERQAVLDAWLAGDAAEAEPDILRELGVAA